MSGASQTLRRTPEIRRVMANGRRISGSRVVLYVLPEGSRTRAGFASPRAIGGAVIRNRARRLMKEAWRALGSRVGPGFEVMVVARPEIRGARLPDVVADLERLLHAAGVVE
jgi:ribonuclease P protein component